MDNSNKQMKNQEIKGNKMTKSRIIYIASLVILGVLWGIASSLTLLAMTKKLGFFPDRSGIKIRAGGDKVIICQEGLGIKMGGGKMMNNLSVWEYGG